MPEPAELALIVNGEPALVPAGATVTDLLQRLGIARDHVAVERNRAVVRRALHDGTLLVAGDVIEIVEFVGGG